MWLLAAYVISIFNNFPCFSYVECHFAEPDACGLPSMNLRNVSPTKHNQRRGLEASFYFVLTQKTLGADWESSMW